MSIIRKTFVSVLPVLLSVLFLLPVGVSAQDTPLTLAEILTALQSKSSDMTVEQLNTFITQRVTERGVTFSTTPVILAELNRAGASSALISIITANGSNSNQTSTTNSTDAKPDVKFTRLWVDKNVERSSRLGMVVHVNFTVYNLKETPLKLTVRVQGSDGKNLKSSNSSFANKAGDLALFRNFNPPYQASVYKDANVFIPYDEMPLGPGSHDLKVDADVIYPKGTMLKHLTLQALAIQKPVPSLRAPKATLGKMWVDYDVTESGRKGMRIHFSLKAINLKDTLVYLKVKFEDQNGARLTTSNTLFTDRSGEVTLSKELRPGYATANYKDESVFMPYDELRLRKGMHQLRMHAILTYPDGGLIKDLKFIKFRITQP